MKIVFDTEDLRNECNNQESLVKRYGVQVATLLRQRLDELFNAEVLEVMRSMPHVAISGPAQGPGDLALELGPAYRLAFRPQFQTHLQGVPWDWKKIDSIRVLGLSAIDAKPNE